MGGTKTDIVLSEPNVKKLEKGMNELDFVVLSDEGNRVAGAYGVAFKLPEPVVDKFRGRLDIPAYNGDETWSLPLAATYVIDTDGRVTYAFLHHDYRERAEPQEVVDAPRETVGG